MCSPSLEHEAARLAALRECDIMDTEPEPAFDELTRLAATICQAPIATVCLVDDHRQWNKSVVGTSSRESGRDECFCGYAINNLGPLIVPDATKDPRFANIPEVLGKPFFRAYAGIPVVLPDGHALGMLCVIDKKPRSFTVEQVDALHMLARQTAAQLELRRRTRLHAKLESKLRASEERYRGVVESQTELICRFKADTTLTFVNDAYCRRAGKRPEEIIGRSFLDFIPVSQHDGLREHLASIPPSGEPVKYEHAGPRPDGTIGWQRWTDRAILNRAGEIVEYQGFGWDVTDRKLIELALLKSESKFRSVAQYSPFGLFVTNIYGDCTYANPAYERISGLTEQQALGKGWIAAIHPDDLDRVVHEWYSAAREARDFASEHRFVHPDGRTVHSMVRVAPFHNEHGVEGFVGTVKDCTDYYLSRESLKHANAQLRETNLRLEQRHNELVQLAYAMTHDLQTPVATISGVVNILESRLGMDGSATVAANLARARRAADRLTDMLDSLMLYAKSGGEQLELRTLNVGAVLREVVREHFAGDQHNGVVVERADDAQIRADHNALERCLVNLLHNAVKFSGASRPDPRVQASVEVNERTVRATIKDNGPGIPPEKIEQMFLPFKRGPLAGRGTGLGLSTVRRYIEGFGGRVWLESDGYSGTTANIELPLHAENLAERNQPHDNPHDQARDQAANPAPPTVVTVSSRSASQSPQPESK